MLFKDIVREMRVSEAIFYNWTSKFGGMYASDVKRIKELAIEVDNEPAFIGKLFSDWCSWQSIVIKCRKADEKRLLLAAEQYLPGRCIGCIPV